MEQSAYYNGLLLANKKIDKLLAFVWSESLPGEVWKEIPHMDSDYFVSNKGRVLSLCFNKPRILKPQICGNDRGTGYYYVSLKGKNKRINRLVATAFLENPEGKPISHHKDNNKLNNDVSNLAFATHSENTRAYYESKKQWEEEKTQ